MWRTIMIKIIYNNGYEQSYENLNELFFVSLVNGAIDFNNLSTQYVKYLKMLESNHTKQLSEMDIPLIEAVFPSKHLSDKQRKDVVARYLVKYGRFENAPIWKELMSYVEENKININGEYCRDLYLKDDEDE